MADTPSMLLNRILELEESNTNDKTGKKQHGFKKHSTFTMGLLLQSLIFRALFKKNTVVFDELRINLFNLNLMLNLESQCLPGSSIRTQHNINNVQEIWIQWFVFNDIFYNTFYASGPALGHIVITND